MTPRDLYNEYTKENGGVMQGGYGFLHPDTKKHWEYFAKRLSENNELTAKCLKMEDALQDLLICFNCIKNQDGFKSNNIEAGINTIKRALGLRK